MATVRVVLRKCRKLKDSRYPIAVRLTHNKKVKYIFTGHSALVREWSGKYPLYLNGKHPNHKELNTFLLKEYTRVNEELIILEQAGKSYSVYELHSKSTHNSSPTTLFKFAESLIDKLTRSGRIENAENYKTAINAVKRFSNGKDFHFEEINYKCLTDFEYQIFNLFPDKEGNLWICSGNGVYRFNMPSGYIEKMDDIKNYFTWGVYKD